MKYENPTNVILDVKFFETGKTFKVSKKENVDFITDLLENSKHIDGHCDGIIDYAITYDELHLRYYISNAYRHFNANIADVKL